MKIHLLQLSTLSGPVTHSKSIPSYFPVLNAVQKLTSLRTVWRASSRLPHLKKKYTIVIDSKEAKLVISRLSARTLHVFQITLQHCTTKKYAEIFHLE